MMRFHRFQRLLMILLLAFATTGLTGCFEGSEASVTDRLAASLDAAAESQTRFGLELYRTMAEEAGEETVFISPLSIYIALGMALNGAQGETYGAMAEALHLGELTSEQLNESVKALIDRYDSEEIGARLRIANGLWYRQGERVSEEFVSVLEGFYAAQTAALDFGDPRSAEIVNDWMKEKTEGMIPDMFERLDAELLLLLVNAVYFRGEWSVPFDPDLTQPGQFTLISQAVRRVPMMQRAGRFDHYQGEGFQAVRLPYGDEGRLAMYLFLPDRGSGLTELNEVLTYEDWQAWLSGFTPKMGKVRLPRMDLSYKQKLNAALQSLGMAIVFDPQRADFGGIRPISPSNRVYISEVNHQAVLLVNEEGTEAAAATSIGFQVTSVPVYEFEFVADRPFLLAVRDEETGVLLFIGAVYDPGTVA